MGYTGSSKQNQHFTDKETKKQVEILQSININLSVTNVTQPKIQNSSTALDQNTIEWRD